MQQQHLGAAPLEGGVQFARRVIIHLDLDCFYCQVEQKRLNIPRHKPCAVQQWQGLIAVNYAARAAGITRHMRVHEAKKICPELELVHVETIGNLNLPDSAEGGAAAAAEEVTSTADGEGSAQDRESSKASLQRYRRASAEIMRVLSQMCPGCLLEKASIDEAYLDITPLAVRELAAAEAGADGGAPGAAGDVSSLLAAAADASSVLGDGGLQADIDYDRLAAAGAVVAFRLRTAVSEQLELTVSAGVACNKLLAKIGSARNKPNKQTIVLPRAVEDLMRELPLGKVKGLGGKLGAQLEKLGAPTAGAAAALPWETLMHHFDTRARWVYNVVRGIDSEPVTPKDKVKSINSCKSFGATSDPAAMSQWLGVLAQELADRMAEDEAEHGRRSRTLVLQYRGGPGRVPDRSIRGAMPTFKQRDTPDAKVIAAAALALFKRILPAPWPLHRLALVATEFTELSGSGAASGAAMARFLAGTHTRHQEEEPRPVEQQHSVDQQQEQQQQLVDSLGQRQALGQLPAATRPNKPNTGSGLQQQQLNICQLKKQSEQQQSNLQTLNQQPEHWQNKHVQQQNKLDLLQLAKQHTLLQPGQQQLLASTPLPVQQRQQPSSAPQAGPSLLQPAALQTSTKTQHLQHQEEDEPEEQQHQVPMLDKQRHMAVGQSHQPPEQVPPAAPSGLEDELLREVNIAEQARLLREAELQQLRQQGSRSSTSKKRKLAAASGRQQYKEVKHDKQQSITDMFGRSKK